VLRWIGLPAMMAMLASLVLAAFGTDLSSAASSEHAFATAGHPEHSGPVCRSHRPSRSVHLPRVALSVAVDDICVEDDGADAPFGDDDDLGDFFGARTEAMTPVSFARPAPPFEGEPSPPKTSGHARRAERPPRA
jgi:hypothetical protein